MQQAPGRMNYPLESQTDKTAWPPPETFKNIIYNSFSTLSAFMPKISFDNSTYRMLSLKNLIIKYYVKNEYVRRRFKQKNNRN